MSENNCVLPNNDKITGRNSGEGICEKCDKVTEWKVTYSNSGEGVAICLECDTEMCQVDYPTTIECDECDKVLRFADFTDGRELAYGLCRSCRGNVKDDGKDGIVIEGKYAGYYRWYRQGEGTCGNCKKFTKWTVTEYCDSGNAPWCEDILCLECNEYMTDIGRPESFLICDNCSLILRETDYTDNFDDDICKNCKNV